MGAPAKSGRIAFGALLINIAFIALNLDTALRGLLFRLYWQLRSKLEQALEALMARMGRNLKFGY